ncbi:MAG: hypothetical protein GVY16_10425 [Planctomycetes bacterium]|jgi:DNA polymerase-3 subunit delta'|nr:hypothetical protein [Planctomycetota bacterium]
MIHLQDIIGQQEATGRLRTCLAADRMPHAFLFAGPDGVGRETTALALAALLLCESPQTDLAGQRTACGSCQSCRLIAGGNHPDVHRIYKELARYHENADIRNRKMQSLGIEVIRSFLLAPAGRASTQGQGKVFIVLETELLTIEAQNSMLKILEEPPPKTTIILVCGKADMLLPTTRSRCALIRFGALPHDFVIEKLAAAEVQPTEAAFWAAFTDGSVGGALDHAAAGLYDIKCDILGRLAALGPAGDVTLGESLATTSDTLAEAEVKRIKKSAGADLAKTLATRRAAAVMLQLIAAAYRDAMTVATGAERVLINADQAAAVADLAARHDPDQIAEILQQLSRYERLLWRNVAAKTVWDNVVLTCASAATLNV